jgi:hypothetical protein
MRSRPDRYRPLEALLKEAGIKAELSNNIAVPL